MPIISTYFYLVQGRIRSCIDRQIERRTRYFISPLPTTSIIQQQREIFPRKMNNNFYAYKGAIITKHRHTHTHTHIHEGTEHQQLSSRSLYSWLQCKLLWREKFPFLGYLLSLSVTWCPIPSAKITCIHIMNDIKQT